METEVQVTTSRMEPERPRWHSLRTALALLLGVGCFLIVYAGLGTAFDHLFTGRVIHRGEIDHLAEAFMLVIALASAGAGGAVTAYVEPTWPLLAAGLVGSFAATTFLLAYAVHGALVLFLLPVVAVSILGSLTGGFAGARLKRVLTPANPRSHQDGANPKGDDLRPSA